MGGQPLQFVTEFRYLGHIISNNTGWWQWYSSWNT